MKKALLMAALSLAVCGSAVWACAQETAKQETVAKPPLSQSQAVLESWNDIGRKLIAMAEDFPAEKYDFKPTPAQRSFAEQLLHAAGANYFFTNPVEGKQPPAAEDPKRDQYKTKADVVTFVKSRLRTVLRQSRRRAIRAWQTWAWSPKAIGRSASPIWPTG